MEGVGLTNFWRDKRVALTGHTGFKGGWLSMLLLKMGASVHGFALRPVTEPNLFTQLDLSGDLDHEIGDIRDLDRVKSWINRVRPDVVLHLAAQPLVRHSYREPLLTWEVNVLGSVKLLEAIRQVKKPCAVVVVTTDKVYEDKGYSYTYNEVDRLGGHDPYSSSKAAVELAVASWRKSYFAGDSPISIATARAGNVIGGGDWAEDRIVPDLVRALSKEAPVLVRNPESVRPWQHVLEPLSGYLRLAELLYEKKNPDLEDCYNFGPDRDGLRTVQELVETALRHWPGVWQKASRLHAPKETALLDLGIEQARVKLQWTPRWSFQQAIGHTIEWYQQAWLGKSVRQITLNQIKQYSES